MGRRKRKGGETLMIYKGLTREEEQSGGGEQEWLAKIVRRII